MMAPPPQPAAERGQRENQQDRDRDAIPADELRRLVLPNGLVDLAHQHVLLGGQALFSVG
jgi:hypothetical protein